MIFGLFARVLPRGAAIVATAIVYAALALAVVAFASYEQGAIRYRQL